MNYAFKIVVVVLVLGVIDPHNIAKSANTVRCSIYNCNNSSKEDLFKEISDLSNTQICQIAKSNKGKWETNTAVKEHVREAARRNLRFGIKTL